MAEEQESKLFFLGIFPKCPFYTSAIQLFFIIALIALGTFGLLFLNFEYFPALADPKIKELRCI